MNKLCDMFKKRKIVPKTPDTEKKAPYKNNHREIIQRKKSKLQIRTGKNLTIIPISYKDNFKNISI